MYQLCRIKVDEVYKFVSHLWQSRSVLRGTIKCGTTNNMIKYTAKAVADPGFSVGGRATHSVQRIV